MKKNLKRFYALVLGFIYWLSFCQYLDFYWLLPRQCDLGKILYCNLLGLPLYDIVLNGKTYAGTAIGSNIGTLYSFFAFVALMIEEVWLRLVRRRQNARDNGVA